MTPLYGLQTHLFLGLPVDNGKFRNVLCLMRRLTQYVVLCSWCGRQLHAPLSTAHTCRAPGTRQGDMLCPPVLSVSLRWHRNEVTTWKETLKWNQDSFCNHFLFFCKCFPHPPPILKNGGRKTCYVAKIALQCSSSPSPPPPQMALSRLKRPLMIYVDIFMCVF